MGIPISYKSSQNFEETGYYGIIENYYIEF